MHEWQVQDGKLTQSEYTVSESQTQHLSKSKLALMVALQGHR